MFVLLKAAANPTTGTAASFLFQLKKGMFHVEKQVTIFETTYTLATITMGHMREISFAGKKGMEFTEAFIKASMAASSNPDQDYDSIPFFKLNDVLTLAHEVNGIAVPGESAAVTAEPAATATIR